MKALRTYKFIPILLLSLFCFNLFRIYLPYLNYKINYQYISSVLCENNTKPALNCHGKCFLKKELKKVTEEESKKKNTIEKQDTFQPFQRSESRNIEDPTLLTENKYPAFTQLFYSLTGKIDTPPPKA